MNNKTYITTAEHPFLKVGIDVSEELGIWCYYFTTPDGNERIRGLVGSPDDYPNWYKEKEPEQDN